MDIVITKCDAHHLKVGDRISMEVPDRRLWPRFKHWLLRREPPTVRRELRVLAASASTFCASEAVGLSDAEKAQEGRR